MPSQGRRNNPVRHPFALPLDEYGTAVRLGPATPRADGRRLAAAQEAGEGRAETARQTYDARRRTRTLTGA